MRETTKIQKAWIKKNILERLPKLTVPEAMVLFLALGFYLFWASRITFDYTIISAPDERLRFMLPDFIFRYNRLPTGYDPEAIYRMGNWSYAFYPQWLGPILSAFFMNVASLIRSGPFVLVFAARLTSVLAGVTTVFFVNRTLRILTKNEKISLLGMALVAFWPQFAFLSSYVNNDIIPVAGISIMCYAVAVSLQDKWTLKSSLTLGIGKVICLLSYLNSAGFVLAFGLYFLVSNAIDIRKKQIEWKEFRKCFMAVFLVVAILWFPFLIRNAVLYEGDILGIASFNRAMVEWEQNESMAWAYENARIWSYFHDEPWDEGTVLRWVETWTHFQYRDGYLTAGNPYEGTLFDLLRNRLWVETTVKSFITTIFFAYTRSLPRYIYVPYLLLMLTPLLGLLRIGRLKAKEMTFFATCIFGAGVTVGIFLYYNLYTDMQSQGRYLITILVPLVIGATLGMNVFLEKLPEGLKKLIVYSGVIGSAGMLLIILRAFMRLCVITF